MKRGLNIKLLIICIVAVYAFAFIGSLFTSQNVNTDWYDSIKPSITPPSYIFPIVWNILFFLIAISLYLAIKNSNPKFKTKIIIAFTINLILNALWSYVFFSMQNPSFAFYELLILWFSIISMIYFTYQSNKTSSYLLIPYFLWVSFAGILNYLIAF